MKNDIVLDYLNITRNYRLFNDDFIDKYFLLLKQSIIDLYAYDNRIHLCPIESDKYLIELFEHDGHYTIIWDMAYWDFYSSFLTNNLLAGNSGFDLMRNQQYQIYKYLYNRTKNINKELSAFFFSKKESLRPKIIVPQHINEKKYEKYMGIAKMFTLQHEIHHIYQDINKGLVSTETEKYKKIFSAYINSDDYKSLLNNDSYLNELTADYQAFFELITMMGYQIHNANLIYKDHREISNAINHLMLFNNQIHSLNLFLNTLLTEGKFISKSTVNSMQKLSYINVYRSKVLSTLMPNCFLSFAYENKLPFDFPELMKSMFVENQGAELIEILSKYVDNNVGIISNDLFEII